MNTPNFRRIDLTAAKRSVQETIAERDVPMKVTAAQLIALTEGKGASTQPTPQAPQQIPNRTPTRKYTTDLPDYVIDEIRLRAFQAKPRCTDRHIILLALRAFGISIKEEDMVPDGRRPKRVA